MLILKYYRISVIIVPRHYRQYYRITIKLICKCNRHKLPTVRVWDDKVNYILSSTLSITNSSYSVIIPSCCFFNASICLLKFLSICFLWGGLGQIQSHTWIFRFFKEPIPDSSGIHIEPILFIVILGFIFYKKIITMIVILLPNWISSLFLHIILHCKSAFYYLLDFLK